MADTRSSVKGSFRAKFAGEWKRRYALGSFLAAIFFIIPGVISVVASISIIYLALTESYSLEELFFNYAFVSISVLQFLFVLLTGVFFISAGLLVIIAPRMLSPVALGIIERLDLSYILFLPIIEEDFRRNRFLEQFAGAPVGDERVNRSLRERIWWLSSRTRPEAMFGGIPKYLSLRYPDLPRSLLNPSLPVGRLGKLVVRQWYFYLSAVITWAGCCNGCILVVPLFLYRTVLYVHSLAYGAAYLQFLTGDWPWETSPSKHI